MDISQNALEKLQKDLNEQMLHIGVKTKQGDYFEVLESLKENQHPKVILFLGSNIGNMPDEVAEDFIANLSENLNFGDKFFLGVDLIKPAAIVLPAYNDSKGVTASFNLNLLERIGRSLAKYQKSAYSILDRFFKIILFLYLKIWRFSK